MAKHEGSEFAWFLAGVTLGLAGALLAAPQSGEETRRQLRQQAERGRERLREARRKASERGRELVDEAAESGRRVFERGQELYKKGRNLAEETAADLGEAPTPEPLADAGDTAPGA
jgi:gas vesicle protein